MVFSFNREFMRLDEVSDRMINNVPNVPSIYDLVLEDIKKETLVSLSVLYGNEGDTKLSLLRNSSNYVVNTILCDRMKFDDNKLECILMGLNCEDCQNREFTRLESECFNSCSLNVIVIDIDYSKFKKINLFKFSAILVLATHKYIYNELFSNQNS